MPAIRATLPLLLSVACTGPEEIPTSDQVTACEPVKAALERADGLMDLGSVSVLPQVEDLLQDAESRAPKCAGVWIGKGRLERAWPKEAGGSKAPRNPQAVAHLERALQLAPHNNEAILALSALLFTTGAHQRAETLISGLLDREADHPAALLRHGEILVASGRPDQAEAVLARSIEQAEAQGDPLTAFQAQGTLGLAYERLGRVDRAEALLLEAAAELDAFQAEHPGQTKINCPHESLARLYVHSGRHEQAAHHAVRAAELRPWMPELLFQAAHALLEAGDSEGARLYLERGLAVDDGRPSHPRDTVRRRLRRVGAVAGGSEAALASALRLTDRYHLTLADSRLEGVTEASADILVVRGFLALLGGDPEGARPPLEAAHRTQPDHPGARVGRAWLALEAGDAPAAAADFEAALSAVDLTRAADEEGLDWQVAKLALMGNARVGAMMGDEQHAHDAYTQVLEHRPEDQRALLGLGNALNGLGQPERAAGTFRRVLLLEPDQPQALAGLGSAMLNQGEHALAEALFEAARERGVQGWSCPYEGLGLVHLAQGDTELGQRWLERAVEVDPDSDHRKYDELARMHIEAGNTAEAERLLRKSLANHPAGEEAQRMLEVLSPGTPAPPGAP